MANRLYKFDSAFREMDDIYGEPWEAGAAMWQLERVYTVNGREPTPSDLAGLAVGGSLRLTDEFGRDDTVLTRGQ